jgi:pimeloyl-ACP methyl ester carboxylesterase
MVKRQTVVRLGALAILSLSSMTCATQRPSQNSPVDRVASKDGTLIAVECDGAGPSLVIVHGGTGDRKRWTALFPLLSSHFTVCAMDRRGHGESGDAADYSLQKETEDVVAVVNSRPGPVFLLGHSYGGVASLEAALVTKKVSKLILYEPPLQDLDHSAVADRMERMIETGDREEALLVFMREIVMISPNEIMAMRARPSWPGLVASVETTIRQDRALASYRLQLERVRTLQAPTLLLTGSLTSSPQLKLAIHSLDENLPKPTLVVLEGQEHNAMDTDREEFATVITDFLLGVVTERSAQKTTASPTLK